jgi:hypothetical protein
VIVVIIERKSMLHRGQGVTEILTPTGQGAADIPSVSSPR